MSIQAIVPVGGDLPLSNAIRSERPTGMDFSALLGEGMNRVDTSLRAADTQLRELAAGEDIPLHDVMITMERARMDLTLMAEARNRLLEAYQELMRMQL